MWNQVYNPFNSSTISTLVAAIPVVVLLVLIATNKVKAHIAAIIALVLRQSCGDLRIHDARQYVASRIGARRRHRLLPDRLDRPQRHLHVSPHGG